MLKNGQEEAFTELFNYYRPAIYDVASRFLQSHALAEEMVQDVFLKVWLKRAEMSAIRNFNGYLFIMARNMIFDRIKKISYETIAKAELGKEEKNIMYFGNAISNIFLTMNAANVSSDAGNSVWPFIGFLMFLFGVVITFAGLIMASAAKREWNVFYAPHDVPTEDIKTKKKKGTRKGRIVYILGIIMLVGSFFVK